MSDDTIQKIADDLEGFILLSDQKRKTLADRLRALSARASAGEGGEWVSTGNGGYFAWNGWRLFRHDGHCVYAEQPMPDGTRRALYLYDDQQDNEPHDMLYALVSAVLTTAPQPAQAGASGGGEDWRETERLRLLKLRQLLEGFEVEIEAEGLESPATYLDRVTLVGRFQPSAGGPEVAKRIAAILAAPVRDATPASPATGEEGLEQIGGLEFYLHEDPDAEDEIEPVRLVMAMSVGNKVYCHRITQGNNGICCDATPPARGDGEGDTRESRMVVIRRDASGKPAVWCDPEIADLVSALNAGGIPTAASCSGHGERHGNIALADGRELLIAPDYDTARAMDATLLTRPTPETRDTERLDYIERTFSGVTNSERYLPVQMIWGKGCNGRTLREACDKYMKRDAALALPAQGEGNNG